MSRILSIFMPTLATDRLRRTPETAGAPLATVAKVKGAQRLAALDAKAAALPLQIGMGLADARAVCPGLQVADADPAGEAETLRRLLDWSRRFTPLAALDPPDGLLLDIAGAAHLAGGEAALIDTIETTLAARGWAVRCGLADTPEAAWALARFGDRRVAAPGFAAIQPLAEPLPLAALRLDPATVTALAQAGLRRIGDILMRPRGPITARFGSGLFARLDGLLGLTKSPIRPTFPVPVFMAERRTLHGLTHIEAVESALLVLAHRLAEQLLGAGQGARRLEALFFRVDGAVKRMAVGTSRPSRDPAGLARLFSEKLAAIGEDGLDTGYGFDLIRLSALAVDPLGAAQGDLDTGGSGEAARDAEFALLVDRLGARLGFTRVVRLRNADQHRPEDAACEIPTLRDAGAAVPDDADLVRPLRLFDRPEPIETVATVPDGPPARFTWRRATHLITAIEGPERLESPWWNNASPLRDYFQAEDGQGHRFWLYREGIYQAEAPQPKWFLHGLFG